ncbi:MAG: hypothetical protein EU539_12210 [Promethearchaeota archaeon]|nr:MAG: hypothetical protein EU539_12210 [Candidatus Lokiarchaeota archaeon]
MSSLEVDIDRIIKQAKGKIGIFCINCLIMKSNFTELNNFININKIEIPRGIRTKTGYLTNLAIHYYKVYKEVKRIQNKYSSSIELMGEMLLKDQSIKNHLINFDYISKQELIDIFADYCADFQINVYDASGVSEYQLDLYLTKKTPLLRTEAVFVRTGSELEEESNYDETLNLMIHASEIAMWTLFVSTPAGIYKIGLEKFINDMEKLNAWSYVVDPLHMKIYGITKGKKSKNHEQKSSEAYIQKLPREPIRAPSQVVEISKYEFKENESYKPKNFQMFELITEEEYLELSQKNRERKKYDQIFRSLLIIEKDTGISIFAHSNENQPLDDVLVSGFLTAMDQFVQEIGGSSSLEEIDYKGFFVQAAYGKEVKIALFLSESSDQILRERLAFFVKKFEERYAEQIAFFKKTGNVARFNRLEIATLVKEILEI